MISELKPKGINVLSLTTIATPHHGSAFADYLFKRIGPTNVPKLYRVLESFGIETGAFEQLTNRYMKVGKPFTLENIHSHQAHTISRNPSILVHQTAQT